MPCRSVPLRYPLARQFSPGINFTRPDGAAGGWKAGTFIIPERTLRIPPYLNLNGTHAMTSAVKLEAEAEVRVLGSAAE